MFSPFGLLGSCIVGPTTLRTNDNTTLHRVTDAVPGFAAVVGKLLCTVFGGGLVARVPIQWPTVTWMCWRMIPGLSGGK